MPDPTARQNWAYSTGNGIVKIGVAVPGCLSRNRIFPSGIPGSERYRIPYPIWVRNTKTCKEMKYLTPKKCTKLSEI